MYFFISVLCVTEFTTSCLWWCIKHSLCWVLQWRGIMIIQISHCTLHCIILYHSIIFWNRLMVNLVFIFCLFFLSTWYFYQYISFLEKEEEKFTSSGAARTSWWEGMFQNQVDKLCSHTHPSKPIFNIYLNNSKSVHLRLIFRY